MDSLNWVRVLTIPSIVVALGTSIFMFSRMQRAMPKFSASFNRTSESFEELKENCHEAFKTESNAGGDKDPGDLLREKVDSFNKFCEALKLFFDDDGLFDSNKFCAAVLKALGISRNVDANVFCVAVQKNLASCENVGTNEFCEAVKKALNLSETVNVNKFCEDIQKDYGVENSMDLDEFCFSIKKALNRWALHKNLESCKKSWVVLCDSNDNS